MPPVKPTLTAKALMALLDVSRSTVYAWVSDGCPHRRGPKGNEFVVADVVTWLQERAEARGRAAVEGQNGATPYARKTMADAIYRELQTEQLRGDLIDAATVEAEYQRFVGGFAAVAAGRLQHFERDIVQAVTPADARRLTQRQHVALLEGAREYADQIEQMPDEDEADEETEPVELTVEGVA